MDCKATYLGSNGWYIQLSKTNILIDPWLTGDLVFPPGEWFFKGTLENDIAIPQEIHLLLLTQGLPDHCHIPSLKHISKEITVICSKSAHKIINKLGFTDIKIMEPNDKLKYMDLEIEATPGAPVPTVENGYIVKNNAGSFYIEPHGFFDKKINSRKLDIVITPTKNLKLPILGSFVKGADVLPDLIKTFKPQFVLSSTVGGDASYSGILNKLIKIEESEVEPDCKLINLDSMQSLIF